MEDLSESFHTGRGARPVVAEGVVDPAAPLDRRRGVEAVVRGTYEGGIGLEDSAVGGVFPAASWFCTRYFPAPGGPRSGTIAPLGGLCWFMLGYFFDVFLMLFMTSVLMAFDLDFRAN